MEQKSVVRHYSTQLNLHNRSLTYLFRDKREGLFSIENIFSDVGKYLSHEFEINHFSVNKSISKAINAIKVSRIETDIIHLTGDVNYLAIASAKHKTILTIHDLGYYENPVHSKLNKILYRMLWLDIPLRRVNNITAISTFTANKLAHYFPFTKNKTHVIHNPVSKIFAKRQTKTLADRPVILLIGNGNHKNMDRLFEAVVNINCHLSIIGKLTDKQRIFLSVNKISFSDYFDLSLQEVVEHYNNADVLYFASLYEGFGLPIAEANTVGLPVITSTIAAMPEVAGNAAYFVNPLEVAEIRKGIKSIFNNQSLRDDLIEKGFVNAKRFELSTIANQYKTLYNQLV